MRFSFITGIFIILSFGLQRVRQRAEYSTRDSKSTVGNSSDQVALFDDVALGDIHEQSVIIGRVERIILCGERGNKDYKRPVSLNAENKDIITAKYPFLGEEGECFAFSSDNFVQETKKFKDVIATIDLTVTNDKLTIDKDIHTELENIVVDTCSRSKSNRNARKRTQTSF